MSILIFSIPGDAHAIIAELALRSLRVESHKIFLPDLPVKASATIRLGSGISFRHKSEEGEVALHEHETVWFRRVHSPVLGDAVHPDDRQFAERSWKEIRLLYEQVFRFTGAFCVNPPASYPLARSKPVQLHLAREAGLLVPDTLISNDADDICAFIAENAKSGARTIVKNFSVPMWYNVEERTGYAAGTEVVTRSDVLDSNVRGCPAIYQRYIAKSYEVRIARFGNEMVAARLRLQSDDPADVDFRRETNWSRLGIAPVEIPANIRERVSELFSRLSLLTGSIDFVVDERGQWHFLEINEMGNFLWLEKYCPELPVLDIFCRFLISRDPNFSLPAGYRPRLRLAGLAGIESLSRRIVEETARHPDSDAYAASVETVDANAR